jgi:2'-5' RNA ligase
MTSPATVGGGEHLRLFCALKLPDTVLDRLVEWQRHELGDARGARVLSRTHLHVTLVFLGSRPATELPAIADALRTTAAEASPPRFTVRRYRETSRVGMVELAEQEPRHAHRLAGRLMLALEELGVYERERRDWLPHVSVARFREQPRLQPSLPDLGEFSPSEAAVYHSLLRPGGAQYETLETFALGG